MNRTNPLVQFHNGIHFPDPQVHVPWHVTHPEFLGLVPAETITSVNRNWICADLMLFGIQDNFAFNFIPHPEPVFHEIQVYDQDPKTMTQRFTGFAVAIKSSLGDPSMEFDSHIRWHDNLLVLDLSISDVRNTPDGPQFPRFMLSFQNSTLYAPHWNNRSKRRSGLEQWG